jgi:hypothetical protein
MVRSVLARQQPLIGAAVGAVVKALLVRMGLQVLQVVLG